jgi:hypothetical protein
MEICQTKSYPKLSGPTRFRRVSRECRSSRTCFEFERRCVWYVPAQRWGSQISSITYSVRHAHYIAMALLVYPCIIYIPPHWNEGKKLHCLDIPGPPKTYSQAYSPPPSHPTSTSPASSPPSPPSTPAPAGPCLPDRVHSHSHQPHPPAPTAEPG